MEVGIGAGGSTGKERAEWACGDGYKVGALTEGVGRDGDGCPSMVDEGSGCLRPAHCVGPGDRLPAGHPRVTEAEGLQDRPRGPGGGGVWERTQRPGTGILLVGRCRTRGCHEWGRAGRAPLEPGVGCCWACRPLQGGTDFSDQLVEALGTCSALDGDRNCHSERDWVPDGQQQVGRLGGNHGGAGGEQGRCSGSVPFCTQEHQKHVVLLCCSDYGGGYLERATPPPPCASTRKFRKMTVTPGPGAWTRRCFQATSGAKERVSPKTCPYLTLSTIAVTGHYNTMCGIFSASSGGPHCLSGASGAVE